MESYLGYLYSSAVGSGLVVVGWSTMNVNLPNRGVLEAVVSQTFFSVAVLARAGHAATTQGCSWRSLHWGLCSVRRGGRSTGAGSSEHGRAWPVTLAPRPGEMSV